MFIPIQKILPKTIAAFGIKREVDAAIICEKYRKFAPRFVHTNALANTLPKSYRGKTLTVGVANGAWAEQVVSQKKALIEAINQSLGKKLLEDIKTKVVDGEDFRL